MPLFIGIHKRVQGTDHGAVAGVHQPSLAIPSQHDVRFLNYWTNTRTGAVVCLVEAPDREAAIRAHREGHGTVEDEITAIREDA